MRYVALAIGNWGIIPADGSAYFGLLVFLATTTAVDVPGRPGTDSETGVVPEDREIVSARADGTMARSTRTARAAVRAARRGAPAPGRCPPPRG